jgi:hypothetical protein
VPTDAAAFEELVVTAEPEELQALADADRRTTRSTHEGFIASASVLTESAMHVAVPGLLGSHGTMSKTSTDAAVEVRARKRHLLWHSHRGSDDGMVDYPDGTIAADRSEAGVSGWRCRRYAG